MNVKDICQNVLAEVGWPVPSSLASNTDATAQQIFKIANAELRALSEEMDWPQLETEYTFSTVVGQTEYAWPDDFRNLAFDSVFDATEYYRIRGSIPLGQWNRWRYGLEGQLSHQRFRQTYNSSGNPVIQFSPAPSSVKTLVAFYYSKNYARNSAGDAIEFFVTDDDVPRVPARLVELGVKWRFRRAKGLDYSAELAEYNGTTRTQFAKYAASSDIAVGGPAHVEYLTEGYVPDNGFGV